MSKDNYEPMNIEIDREAAHQINSIMAQLAGTGIPLKRGKWSDKDLAAAREYVRSYADACTNRQLNP